MMNYLHKFLLISCMLWGIQAVKSQSLNTRNLRTDKANYAPGSTVNFTAHIDSHGQGLSLNVEYWQLTKLVSSKTVDAGTPDVSWSWATPNEDFKGYTVLVKLMQGTTEKSRITTGVDVSSAWGKFPRYGFLSDYNQTGSSTQDEVLENLNRHHINGLQFYDCLYGHHKPIPDDANDGSVWKNILGHTISFATVKNYISKAHGYNMKAMFYDLIYGALWYDANNLKPGNDGVKNEWYIYTDIKHEDVWDYPMSGTSASLLHTNPGNAGWQDYMNNQMNNLYNKLPFDGFHMDQVGEWPTVQKFSYLGSALNLPAGFGSFIAKYKSAFPNKSGILNSVTQYGQPSIGAQNVDFMYSEVWQQGNENDYKDVAAIIRENSNLSGGKNSVLAAYINYKKGGNFNDASVLRFNSVAFAWGASHIELGEHMLSNEYYPDGSMSQSDNLKTQLVKYYDFLTAYENLLRGGGIKTTHQSVNNSDVVPWDKVTPGKIASFNVFLPDYEVVHFLNFNGSKNLLWRDDKGTDQGEPAIKTNLQLSFEVAGTIKNVYYASPDRNSIELTPVVFTQTGNMVSCTLPSLKYWSMLVAERTTPANCPNNCIGAYKAKNANMFIGGDFSTPAWSPGEQKMVLIDNNTWKLTGVYLPGTVVNLAFTNYYGWLTKWGGTKTMSGIALEGNANMTFTPPSAGNYTFIFNDSSLAYSIKPDSVYSNTNPNEKKSTYPSMNFTGGFIGWSSSANPMTLVADYTWRVSGISFNTTCSGQCKEVVFTYNNWEKKFGGVTGMQGTALDVTSAGSNITIDPVMTDNYTVTFNDKTLAYSIVKDGTLDVNDRAEVSMIECHPNPMNEALTLYNPLNAHLNKVKLVNFAGQLQVEKNLNTNDAETQLNVSELAPGMYFVQVYSDKGIKTIKVIKNK
jgi:dextranase